MKERFKEIPKFNGTYQIGSLGSVKSYLQHPNGKILKWVYDSNGYCRVKLWYNGKSKAYSIHRLVAKSFVPNVKNKPEINHKNGNKKDNYYKNLEWCTRSENNYHAYGTGLKKPSKSTRGGKFNSRSKPVLQIFENGKSKKWEGIRDAARHLNLSPGNIWGACNGAVPCGGFNWRYAL